MHVITSVTRKAISMLHQRLSKKTIIAIYHTMRTRQFGPVHRIKLIAL